MSGTDSRSPVTDAAAPVDPSPALVAGTLVLMSCYAQHGHSAYASRVVANLSELSGQPMLSAELRSVCARLAERWRHLSAGAPASSADRPGGVERPLQ
ncbi:MAG: hypothetical protein U1F51_08885 [Burkholderiales bacterium]